MISGHHLTANEYNKTRTFRAVWRIYGQTVIIRRRHFFTRRSPSLKKTFHTPMHVRLHKIINGRKLLECYWFSDDFSVVKLQLSPSKFCMESHHDFCCLYVNFCRCSLIYTSKNVVRVYRTVFLLLLLFFR